MTAGGLHFGTETEAFRFQGKEHYPEKRVVIGRKRPLQADQRPKLDGAGQEPLKKLSLLGWNSSGELPGLKKTTSGGTPVPSPQVWVVEPIEAPKPPLGHPRCFSPGVCRGSEAKTESPMGPPSMLGILSYRTSASVRLDRPSLYITF